MPKKILQPIRDNPEEIDRLEREIAKVFFDEIYRPLLDDLNVKPSIVKNSTDYLLESIKSGKIYFYRGVFKGRFNATLSKKLKSLGAEWDKKSGGFKIPLGSLSYEIRSAIKLSEDNYIRTVDRLNNTLKDLLPEKIADKLKSKKIFGDMILSFDKRFRKSLKGITVAPELTKEQHKKISDEYTNNMKKYIQEWTEKEIVKLRKNIKSKAFQGVRYESLIDSIQKSYGVSQSKAKFLARQETNLLMSKMRESRYQDAGINEYIWKTVVGSPKHPVRPMHKRLDGKIFSWNNPPITSEDGRRNHPGEDFGCRCYARPVVR